MSNEQGVDAATEAAWTSFRGRLADFVSVMTDLDMLVVDFDAARPDDGPGAAPYVQVCAYDETLVRVEAVSNHWLHERCELSAAGEVALVTLGFEEPHDEPGRENFGSQFERRSADEVAVLVVRALREVYGVPHPAFLTAAGLEVDPDLPVPDLPVPESEADGEDEVAFASDRAGLQALVDAAMSVVYPDLKHDSDGDIPIVAGESAVYLRVRDDRPSVEVFADIVLAVENPERLLVELDLLNAGNPMWKFFSIGTTVTMRYELLASPFMAFQLRWVVSMFVTDVDEIARALAVRVGGRRFFEPDPDDVDAFVSDDDEHPAMTGLLELLHLEKVRPSTVAGLFEHDRLEIIRQLVRIRTGQQSCAEHDPDVVLTLLRKALRIASDGEPDTSRPRAIPPKPRSVQQSLLSDADLGDDALDLGWSA